MTKPLGIRNYGSIPHLPGSRLGPGDHSCHPGQERICLLKTRDRHDRIIVQEKLDGSNVGVANIGGELVPLTRAGYRAETSPYEMHHRFARWVRKNRDKFEGMIEDGERVVGEWLAQAHGTLYALPFGPFVPFDIIRGHERLTCDQFQKRARCRFIFPRAINVSFDTGVPTFGPMTVEAALAALGERGAFGALEPVEGAVWRVERNELIKPGGTERRWRVDFLAKYVRPDKIDGKYLPSMTNQPEVWNWNE